MPPCPTRCSSIIPTRISTFHTSALTWAVLSPRDVLFITWTRRPGRGRPTDNLRAAGTSQSAPRHPRLLPRKIRRLGPVLRPCLISSRFANTPQDSTSNLNRCLSPAGLSWLKGLLHIATCSTRLSKSGSNLLGVNLIGC